MYIQYSKSKFRLKINARTIRLYKAIKVLVSMYLHNNTELRPTFMETGLQYYISSNIRQV